MKVFSGLKMRMKIKNIFMRFSKYFQKFKIFSRIFIGFQSFFKITIRSFKIRGSNGGFIYDSLSYL